MQLKGCHSEARQQPTKSPCLHSTASFFFFAPPPKLSVCLYYSYFSHSAESRNYTKDLHCQHFIAITYGICIRMVCLFHDMCLDTYTSSSSVLSCHMRTYTHARTHIYTHHTRQPVTRHHHTRLQGSYTGSSNKHI